MRKISFKTWWENNRNSDSLYEDYENYCQDWKDVNEFGKPPTFKQFAKKHFTQEYTFNGI